MPRNRFCPEGRTNMALADYRLCDVCDCKVFYDANLNYDQGLEYRDDYTRINGQEIDWSYKLDYLGDWAVICRDCAKTHKTVVVPLNP